MVAVWYASPDTPLKVKDPPTLLFSTSGDPSVCYVWLRQSVCGGEGEKHRVVVEMSSMCRLQLHHTSPSVPVKLPAGSSSISFICTCDRDTARLSKKKKKKKPFGDILPAALLCPLSAYARAPSPQWKFSLRQRCVSVKVTMVICTPGGTHSGVLVQRSQMEGGWIPIRGLTFPSRPSKRRPPSGSRVVCSRSLPSGIRGELWAKG